MIPFSRDRKFGSSRAKVRIFVSYVVEIVAFSRNRQIGYGANVRKLHINAAECAPGRDQVASGGKSDVCATRA